MQITYKNMVADLGTWWRLVRIAVYVKWIAWRYAWDEELIIRKLTFNRKRKES